MDRIIKGVHMGGLGLSYHWEQWEKWLNGSGVITYLDVQFRDIAHHNGWYPELCERNPNAYQVIRHYSETSWTDPNLGYHWNAFSHMPEEYNDPTTGKLPIRMWAKEIVRRHGQFNGHALFNKNVILCGWNEQDLAIEGSEHAATAENPHPDISFYRYVCNWQYALIEAIINETLLVYGRKPECNFGIFKFAGGHEPKGHPPEWEYTIPEAKRLANIHKTLGVNPVILVHHYFFDDGTGSTPQNGAFWHAQRSLRPAGYREDVLGHEPINGMRDPGGVSTQYPNHTIIVAEFGDWVHSNPDPKAIDITVQGYKAVYKAYSDSGRCAGICPFIWSAGEEHKENRFVTEGGWINQTLVDAIAYDVPNYPACELKVREEETPVSKEYEWGGAFAEVAKKYGLSKAVTPLDGKAYTQDPYGNTIAVQSGKEGYMRWNDSMQKVEFYPTMEFLERFFQRKAGN